MKNAIVFVCSLLLMSPLFAQQKLSVQDCIEMALENNIELKNSQLEIDKARATKNEARAEYFPTMSAQALAFDALNPMLTFGIEDVDNAQLRQLLYTLYAEYGANMGLDKEYSFVQNGVMFNAMATEPICKPRRSIGKLWLCKRNWPPWTNSTDFWTPWTKTCRVPSKRA